MGEGVQRGHKGDGVEAGESQAGLGYRTVNKGMCHPEAGLKKRRFKGALTWVPRNKGQHLLKRKTDVLLKKLCAWGVTATKTCLVTEL